MKENSSKIRPILTTSDKIQVYLTTEFQQKVNYLCNMFPMREWSGMLFYNIRDTTIDMSLFNIDVVDFFLMSVDTVAHTDFEYEGTYVQYLIDSGLLGCQHGLIHSHNEMPVFFSSEDMSELQDNTGNHTFYLSLIVNNKFDVTAKMCTIIEMPKTRKVAKYKDINNKTRGVEVNEPDGEFLFVVDCVINKPNLNQPWLNQVETVTDNDKKAHALKVALKTSQNHLTLFPQNYLDKKETSNWNTGKFNLLTETTVKDLKGFVKNVVLGGDLSDNLFQSAKGYDFMDEVDEILQQYDDIFGKINSLEEEITVLKGIVNILAEVKHNSEVFLLIECLNENITIRVN